MTSDLPGHNDIGSAGTQKGQPEGATSLAEVIAQCRALTRLDLDDNNIKSTGAQNLASVLAQCPLLAHLNLSDNKIEQTGQGALQKS
jgi:Ran GTPase-activating protein (RanGAP) involved in mRNA processing and transport